MKFRKRQTTTLDLDGSNVRVEIQGAFDCSEDVDVDDDAIALRVGDTRIRILLDDRDESPSRPPIGTIAIQEKADETQDDCENMRQNDGEDDLLMSPEIALDIPTKDHLLVPTLETAPTPSSSSRRRRVTTFSNERSGMLRSGSIPTNLETLETTVTTPSSRPRRRQTTAPTFHEETNVSPITPHGMPRSGSMPTDMDIMLDRLALQDAQQQDGSITLANATPIRSNDRSMPHSGSVPTDMDILLERLAQKDAQQEAQSTRSSSTRLVKQSSVGSTKSAPGFFSLHRRKQSEDENAFAEMGIGGDSDRNAESGSSRRLQAASNEKTTTTSMVHKEVASRLKLERLCSEPSVTMAELLEALEDCCGHLNDQDSEDELSTPNIYGKLPLHILSENKAMMASRQGRDVLSEFAHLYMEKCPDSIVMQDNQGFVPFAKVVSEWVQSAYRNGGGGESGGDVDSSMHNGNKSWTQRAASWRGKTREPSGHTAMDSSSLESSTHQTAAAMPRSVSIEVDIEWAIQMLSLGFDHIAGKFLPNGKRRSRKVRREAGKHLASRIAKSVPNLIPMLLLIEFDEIRERLLSLSIFRRLLLEPAVLQHHCYGEKCHVKCRCKSWLIHMMRRSGTPSRRAVSFLTEVSNSTVTDYLGTYMVPRAEVFKAYRDSRSETFRAVEELEDIIPSLLALDQSAAQDASSTKIVFNIINNALQRPFVVGVIAKDFVLDIVLLVAFRNAVMLPPIDGSPASDAQEEFAVGERTIILLICSYYILEKISEALSLFSISNRVYLNHLMNVWNVLDMIAIGLLLGTVHMTQPEDVFEHPVLKAVTLGVCWIRLLNVLRAVNLELATFILSIIQIILDIRWFLVVMVLSIVAFGDMIHLVTRTIDDGAICQRDPEDLDLVATDFCSPSFIDSYLRLYIVFVGDFVLTHYKDHGAIVAIFILFTLLGFVVLGNVLIAVVGDSYEKTRTTSSGKFGQARLDFAVAHLSLERMVLPALPMYAAMGDESFAIPGLLFGWFVLISMLVTAIFSALFLLRFVTGEYDSDGLMDVTAVVGAFTLFVCVFVIVHSLLESFLSGRSAFWDRMLAPGGCLSAACVRAITKFVLGMRTNDDGAVDEGERGDEWTSRAEYLVNSIQFVILQAETRLDERMASISEQTMRASQQEIVEELKREINKLAGDIHR